MSEPVTGHARAQVPARLIDLSLGGALLGLDTAFEIGSIHDFILHLGGEAMWVQAEVKRCRAGAFGFEVGVEFVGIDPHDRERLQEFLGLR